MATTTTATSGSHVVPSTSPTCKPTILLITGAWHVPEHYTPLTSALSRAGFTVSCPLLPSNGALTPPGDCDDDILAVRRHAGELTSHGADLLVLAHSYGGVVGSYAFSTPVSSSSPPPLGIGRVVAILYMTAFITRPGEALNDILGLVPGMVRGPPPWAHADRQRNLLACPAESAARLFYQDCSPEEQHRAAELLAVQSYDASDVAPRRGEVLAALGVMKTGMVAGAGVTKERGCWDGLKMTWMREEVRVGYVFCDLDQGLPLAAQEMMVARVRERGVRVDEWHLQAGHSPFVNKPGEVVAAVLDMVGRL